uniref:Heme peroxidase n=1 Tax=Pithovirus LCPAC404 TaxID=2506597 RepID=A0A481ZC98_9VIRU|nr:MAG: heme peroxidase [Pithovirus LCPAC404]
MRKCKEYRTLSGTGNNRKHSEYGTTNQPLLRIVGSDYADGYGSPSGSSRSSARLISNICANQINVTPNKKGASNIFWLYGQLQDHTFSLVDTHDEPFNIPVPKGDPFFDPESTGDKVINMNRSEYLEGTGVSGTPRAYNNILSSFIDGSNIYGSTEERNNYIRTFKYGLLKESHGHMLPITDNQQPNAGSDLSAVFLAGDIRANEHIGLTAIHTLFVREHNYWCSKIRKYYSRMKDEKIYQTAKVIVEAEIQAITFREFLPLLLGRSGIRKYSGYNCEVNPQISNLFSVCCYRLHFLIPSRVLKDNNLKNLFFRSYLMGNKYDLEYIFKYFIKYPCNRSAGTFVSDLRNFLFGDPGQGGHDLCALNVQRGRDHGLPDYNTTRVELGLTKKNSFDEVSSNQGVAATLEEAYGNIDDCDPFIMGINEDKYNSSSMLGELFHTVVTDQFSRIRDGDRFWYENRMNRRQITFINQQTLSVIIKRNTRLRGVPCNVFKTKR